MNVVKNKESFYNQLIGSFLWILPLCGSIWCAYESTKFDDMIDLIMSDKALISFFILQFMALTNFGRCIERDKIYRRKHDKPELTDLSE